MSQSFPPPDAEPPQDDTVRLGPGGSPPPPYGPPPYGAPGYPPPYPQQPYGYGYPPYGYVDPLAKSKLAAGLLGIFLGGFGVHRFYLGYTKIGILQIVVTVLTCGLGHFWGLVEGILYLSGANGWRTDATGRPLKD